MTVYQMVIMVDETNKVLVTSSSDGVTNAEAYKDEDDLRKKANKFLDKQKFV